jgi:hypothetical protein
MAKIVCTVVLLDLSCGCRLNDSMFSAFWLADLVVVYLVVAKNLVGLGENPLT